ncbi:hypothetical protein BC826DRAFT_897973, partial [Russula brevipes]
LHLRPHRRPYGLSIFHQLRCLDVIRRGRLNQHCLNHVWQVVLCRADLALDHVCSPGGGGSARRECGRADTNLCVDWRRVYEELEKDQQEY